MLAGLTRHFVASESTSDETVSFATSRVASSGDWRVVVASGAGLTHTRSEWIGSDDDEGEEGVMLKMMPMNNSSIRN